MPASAPDDIATALAGFDLLKGASPAELKKLAEAGVRRQAKPAEVVLRQGEFGTSMFFVLSGSVVKRMRRYDGSEIVLSVIRHGDTFGELGLAGDRPRPATVIGNEPCTFHEIDRADFARVLARNQAVIQRLDRAYRKAAIELNLYADPLFSDLPSRAISELIDRARMQAYEKGDVIVEEGEEGDAFFLVWSGHVRITRKSDGAERTFAYVAEGDYFGEMALIERQPRAATVIANDHVEVIRIEAEDFRRMLAAEPGIAQKLRERIAQRASQLHQLEQGGSRAYLISDLLKLGAAFASTALVINLERCTRCGACALACHELYGNSRLTRRGKTYFLPGTHEPMLMPNSCWHCKDPECMVGCPTDALRRGPTGEIQVLAERCIGCEICANRCPWGNITMAEPAAPATSWLRRWTRRLLGDGRDRVAAVGGKAVKGKAVKCDLCYGKPYSACVMACPWGAIDRVDPNQYLRRAIEG